MSRHLAGDRPRLSDRQHDQLTARLVLSKAKLDGLNEHYSVAEEGKEYFKVHADDIAEVELLKKYVEALGDEEFARAKTACAIVCSSMYGALDGIYTSRPIVHA